MHLPSDDLCNQIADALVDPGYIIIDGSLPDKILQGLSQKLLQHEQAGLQAAGVGRGKNFQQNQQIRGDSIRWLTSNDVTEAAFLKWMDYLRQALNQHLFLGLQEYESHFAFYPPGAFYQKHLDAFKGKPGRKVSTVLYLNRDWDNCSGGELVLYDGASGCILKSIAPEYGRLVIFLSENFPHEVKTATCNRHSIAGWFKIRTDFIV